MNFNKTFKVFELNLLRQSGIMVTPQQVGLSSDPIATMQLNGAGGMFGNVLNQLNGGNLTNNMALSSAMTPPVLPTPPADPTNAAAQAKYQQDLLTYQSNFQIYNQRFMQLMLSQMSRMQMSMQSNTVSQIGSNSSSSGGGGSSSSDLGIGGIL